MNIRERLYCRAWLTATAVERRCWSWFVDRKRIGVLLNAAQERRERNAGQKGS